MARTRLGELLRPLVTLAPSAPRLPNAIKAGLTVLLYPATPYLLGRFDLGLLTVSGTFAVLYAPAAPIRRRAVTVAGIGAGLVGATTLGAFTTGSPVVFAVSAVLLAMATAGLCLALRPPGSYFLVLCAGIVYLLVGEHGVEPALVPMMTAVGATVAWLVTMAELLLDPRRPERRAVQSARDAVSTYASTDPGPDSRPQRRAAAHALAAAEEAVAGACGGHRNCSPRRWARPGASTTTALRERRSTSCPATTLRGTPAIPTPVGG